MGIKKLFGSLCIILAFVTLGVMIDRGVKGQQPQSSTAPPYHVNAVYSNGVAPGYRPTAGSGLTLNLGPGTANCSEVIVVYAGSTLTMTASVTNYVYLDSTSSCTPKVKTSTFAYPDIPVAIVTASGSAITAINDVRTPLSVPGTVSGTFPTLVASGSTALNTALIAPGACETTVTATATGAVAGENIITDFNGNIFSVTGYNPTLSTGMVALSKWTGTNTINFSVCSSFFNPGNITPAAQTIYWMVLHP